MSDSNAKDMKKASKFELKQQKKANKKAEKDYFHQFCCIAQIAQQGTRVLSEQISNLGNQSKKIQELRVLEHKADQKNHEMLMVLARDFLPPIDTEDIMNVIHALDDVVDAIQDVSARFGMLHVTALRPEAREFADLILRLGDELVATLEQFPNYKKPTELKKHLVELNTLESQGDEIYDRALSRLFSTDQEVLEIIRWREIFELMEACCDAFEHAANAIENVVMKHM